MISTDGWLAAIVMALCGLALAGLGARKNLLLTSLALALAYCSLMIVNASPGDWRDGQFGLEVMVLFVLALPASFVGLLSGKWLARKWEGRKGS